MRERLGWWRSSCYMNLVAVLEEVMALNNFKPIFSCELMKSLTRQRPLRFITESPKLDTLKANIKVSTAEKAKRGYRSKDVLTLRQTEKKFKLVEPGYKVLDIGAAPGSWSKYLANKTNANRRDKAVPVGMVVAINLNDFDSIEGVHCLPKMDFLKASSQGKIVDILGRGKKFDFIFSHLTPPESGVPYLDEDRMIKLVLSVYLFVVKHLRQGGGCLVKLQGPEIDPSLVEDAKKLFRMVSSHWAVEPSALEPDTYLLGRDFMGMQM